MIEINEDGLFGYSIHISPSDYNAVFLNSLKSIRPAGALLPAENFFRFTAVTYIDGVWTGRVTTPSAGGTFGEAGLAQGTFSELRSERDEKDAEFDVVIFYLNSDSKFPLLHFTERKEEKRPLASSSRGTTASSIWSKTKSCFLKREIALN
ncbi:MAG: hypothetical protein JO334_16815 [Verrucomicrobia bacterium]|nr:hypothetical protein [Verrucomicrobiota bacterium]